MTFNINIICVCCYLIASLIQIEKYNNNSNARSSEMEASNFSACL
jgi:hypothetical protein